MTMPVPFGATTSPADLWISRSERQMDWICLFCSHQTPDSWLAFKWP